MRLHNMFGPIVNSLNDVPTIKAYYNAFKVLKVAEKKEVEINVSLKMSTEL